MIRALEIFWMALTLLCLAAALFMALAGATTEALILCGVAVVAGFRYLLRRKQRKQMEKR